MLHLLYGPDDFTSMRACEALVLSLGGESDAFVTRKDAGAITWAALRELCNTFSMFSPVQLIVISGPLGAWSGRGEAAGKSGSRPTPEEFSAFIQTMPESTHVILQEGALAATNK